MFGGLTQFEFPNVSMYDGDLRELLKHMKVLYNEYDAMYKGFKELESSFATINAQFTTFQSRMDGLSDEIDADVRAAMLAAKAELQAQYDELVAAMAAYKVEMNKKLDHFMRDIYALYRTHKLTLESMIEALRENFTELLDAETSARITADEALKALIYTLCENLREDYLRRFAEVNARIDAIVKEFPKVWNIARGYPTDIESAILDAYDAVRYFALRAQDIDNAQKTAQEWDNLNMPAIVADTAALDILRSPFLVLNPFTDAREPVAWVMDFISRELVDRAITADEWLALDITCEEFRDWENTHYYDGAGMTAREFKFSSYNILHGLERVNMREIITRLTADEVEIDRIADWLERAIFLTETFTDRAAWDGAMSAWSVQRSFEGNNIDHIELTLTRDGTSAGSISILPQFPLNAAVTDGDKQWNVMSDISGSGDKFYVNVFTNQYASTETHNFNVHFRKFVIGG